jgi:hypothetical protein
MPTRAFLAATFALISLATVVRYSRAIAIVRTPKQSGAEAHAATPGNGVIGFDRNEYPGDAALPALHRRFAFSGYWLTSPPGAKGTTWIGKRDILRAQGFGFLVLFNGRTEKELAHAKDVSLLGANDGEAAIMLAQHEGFHPATVIFLDQEEGGRMLDAQRAYIHAWVDAVNAAGFRAGVYCSGIPSAEGVGVSVVTAEDIRANANGRAIVFFVYNDSCPPSPGCIYPANPPSPAASGVEFAAVWQFAQSPRRRQYTSVCFLSYADDGKCYARLPGTAKNASESVFLDLDTATSADPSNGRD